jgi:uncharacterized C2H2 Zn-finger protein
MANQQASAQSQSGGSVSASAPGGGNSASAGSSAAAQTSQQATVATTGQVPVASVPGIIDLITCKFASPTHSYVDPRLLECGASACYSCIVTHKDPDKNVKCPFCQGVHKITHDSKLIVNKSLQNFLKSCQNPAAAVQNKQQPQTQHHFVKYLDESLLAVEGILSGIFGFIRI